ncbi:hypothetical protein NDU88_007010 [Pleurodeles waltl]|uniref:Uncharacterized protein n=1 Tax=Pleurodeles waltl TaxID=8319 RepID=A0AAV7WC80_PLEWA|nr:hypothetical protein NDU88_007007 [Pleurodeles waltl]KAJ1211651.1 hypothetical protein NDU88_007008 [Pleurodeles waltl]KAJ1211652.1 hypothetical protein NDU88_007009 [Pleurodeles waltl]KAJ1211653.1 hypothetical protein NDU88_007010 [Pleurodeles waltl]
MFYRPLLYCTRRLRDGPRGERLQQPCVPLAMPLLLVPLYGDALVLLRIKNAPPESAVNAVGALWKAVHHPDKAGIPLLLREWAGRYPAGGAYR